MTRTLQQVIESEHTDEVCHISCLPLSPEAEADSRRYEAFMRALLEHIKRFAA